MNACCVLPADKIPKWRQQRPPEVADGDLICVNTEWAMYSSSLLPRCQEDIDLDKDSFDPGISIFEKLVCGYALGEVCRRIMLSLAHDGFLFSEQNLEGLGAKGAFSTAMLSTIECDTSKSLNGAEAILADSLRVSTEYDLLALNALVTSLLLLFWGCTCLTS